jgi:hypothetical protein
MMATDIANPTVTRRPILGRIVRASALCSMFTRFTLLSPLRTYLPDSPDRQKPTPEEKWLMAKGQHEHLFGQREADSTHK